MAEHGMSALLWDMLTGGAPYKEVLIRTLHPIFWLRFLWSTMVSLISQGESQLGMETPVDQLLQERSNAQITEVDAMNVGALGKIYQDGENIIRQGEPGDCMYVVQDGQVEVVRDAADSEVQLTTLGKHEFFGEMAIFGHEIRSATVRAMGTTRILTIDHKNFLRRIHEDPSLAYRMMQVMSNRIRRLSDEVTQLRQVPSVFDLEEYCKIAFKPNEGATYENESLPS